MGYYVSLLAEARGHRVFPSVQTLQDLKSRSIIRTLSDEIDELIQKNLSRIKSKEFILSIYFGKNLAKQYERLSSQLYAMFQSPLLRVKFIFNRKKWIITSVNTIALQEVPDIHVEYLEGFAKDYFHRRVVARKQKKSSYDLAILHKPMDPLPPSNKKAIKKFIEAGEKLGFRVECISKDDYIKLPNYDALFIRETTSVNHHTYRFARHAVAEGLVVIDDPDSIIRCANKVYLAEILARGRVPRPKTVILNGKMKTFNIDLPFPIILKLPDSSFSQGVVKVDNEADLLKTVNLYANTSDLLIAQEFLKTDFDWRIGVLNNQPLFACKYYMAKKHWQIYEWKKNNKFNAGYTETFALCDVPTEVLSTALKATKLIGNGFYGVDIKVVDKPYVIEINDNPNIDHGIEDFVVGDKLYQDIMMYFLNAVKASKTL